MKKFALLLTICLLGIAADAQISPQQKKHRNDTPQVPPAARYTASFESQHGETFSVFIDGDLVNRMPQTRVMVNDLSDQEHEVIVVLKRPAAKAATMLLRPNEMTVTVNINYDLKKEQLYLYTPASNRGGHQYSSHHDRQHDSHRKHPAVHDDSPLPPPAPEYIVASDEEVDDMVVRMKGQSFNDDRLALGKTLVASTNLSASQIARLAETIDYSSAQVDFLKYAYNYCFDKQNYHVVVDILTFSSDKKKVLDFIATQK